ncbi:hypothetical protein HZA71_02155, partial [Candidatus Falkowbacteria bacterium]|nr:hypothetical protein [Candidatus Falkowbacteria bacterium]
MRRGFALITVTIVTFLFISLGVLFVSFSTADVRIARAHAAATRAYYIDESATALLKHKIEFDPNLRDNFVNGVLNESNSTLELFNVLQANDRAHVYAESAGPGSAKIIAKSDAPLGTASAARTTKTDINRALGDALTDYTMLTSGTDPYMMLKMNMTFNGGIVF